MFLHKFKQIIIPKRVYKNFKFQYQLQVVENLFFSKPFVLFYFFDFMPLTEAHKLKEFLKKEKLKKFLLKKNLLNYTLKSPKYNFLKNLNLNNIILIYPEEKFEISAQIFIYLNQYKNISLLGMIQNFKILRPSEVQKLFKISVGKIATEHLLLKKCLLNSFKIGISYKKHF